MKRYITIAALAALSLTARAQDLRTEITVDRTVLPSLDKTERPSGLTPALYTPAMPDTRLSAAEYASSAWPDSEAGLLAAPASADTVALTPWRGYLQAGYLPLYNLGISAGYRAVDSRNLSAGVWAQYDGESYNGDIDHHEGSLFTTHNAALCGNVSARVGTNTIVRGYAKGALGLIRSPYFYKPLLGDPTKSSFQKSLADAYARLDLQTRTANVAVGATAAAGYFDIGGNMPMALRSNSKVLVRQTTAHAALQLGLVTDDTPLPWVGIDADMTMLRSNDLKDGLMPDYSDRFVTHNMWQWHVLPYLRFNTETVTGRVGANVSIGKNYHAHLRVAPAAEIAWRPSAFVAMYARAEGGEHLNPMSDICCLNPYIDPGLAYGRTNMPLIARGGINIGPYDGMSLCMYGGYAMGRGLLSPSYIIERTGYTRSEYYSADVNSWHIGARLGFAYHELFSLTFDIATGASDSDVHSWYEWLDAPKVVSNVQLAIHPMSALDVTVGYTMRYDRKAYIVVYPFGNMTMQIQDGVANLGTVNDVNLAADYRISPQLTAFVHVENLLCQRVRLVSGMPGPTIHGLLGAAYKF